MSDLWSARWTGPRPELPTAPPKSEPSVSANVAAKVVKPETMAEAPAQKSIEQKPQNLAFEQVSERASVLGASRESLDNRTLDASSSGQTIETIASTSPQSVFSTSSEDQIERLKAALNDDAERAREPQLGIHDARVRVDSMLEKARGLFDLGHLREARHTAAIAHKLSDSASLDYSPDEERPIDLVQRIDDQLKDQTIVSDASEQAQILADQNAEDSDLNPSPGGADAQMPRSIGAVARTLDSSPSNADDPATTKSPAGSTFPDNFTHSQDSRITNGAEIETGGKSRRDWPLNVFRRDRRTAAVATTSAPPVQQVPTGQSSPTGRVIQLGLETEFDPPDAAVVRANRSLTLTAEPSKDAVKGPQGAGAPIAFVPVQSIPHQEPAETDSARVIPEEGSRPYPVDASAWEAKVNESETPTRLPPREIAPPPSDFEELQPMSPFRDVAGKNPSPETQPEAIQCPKPSVPNWVLGVTLFGLCGLVAFFWYRRGAI